MIDHPLTVDYRIVPGALGATGTCDLHHVRKARRAMPEKLTTFRP
jgi:hypothetical protein